MMFIPFFKKIDWSNPPLITLLLILINVLVFVIFQGRDDEYVEEAFAFYLKSDLPSIEIPLYVKHLNARKEFELADEFERYWQARSDEPQQDYQDEFIDDDELQHMEILMLVGSMKMDAEFSNQLKTGKLFDNPQSFTAWQALNAQFESQLHKAISFRYGLKPDNPTVVTMFTNMFLHGGYAHLIGNMVFLFILGFVVEAVLGRSAYGIAYILAGLAGGLLYIAFNTDSDIPTVGASGAIAGLMGMYTVLFGLRKINFFYFVIVYFDYVRAPAIVLLPIWLGHEVVQLLISSGDGVNYYAHIGGICSGALIAYLAKRFLSVVDFDYLDQQEKADTDDRQYEKAMDHLADMQVDKALAILQPLAEQHAYALRYLNPLYKAAKLQPASAVFHDAALRIMQQKEKTPQVFKLIHETYSEYMKLAQPKPKINLQLGTHLIGVFAMGKFFADADKLVKLCKAGKEKESVADAILILSNACQKSGMADQGKAYLEMLAGEFDGTAAAHDARKRLRELAQRTANQKTG